ncbi:MAG: ABC transporter ATP-binding protein [Chlamydiales bacterium]|nr:ABC transporter ATP-binding protein [Chlamydiales bacterium]
MIRANNITKTFKDSSLCIIESISLDLTRGASYAITGPSGVGKSTLLHILGALDFPTTGELLFQETRYQDLNINDLRRKHFGFIFQSYFLLEDLSVLENILLPAQIDRQDTSKQSPSYTRAIELLNQVGLLNRKDSLASTLSGGEKQRACIARALVNDPSIIFADEPTGNIDQSNALIIQNLLIDACRSSGKTLVLVTHDMKFASRLDYQYQLQNKNIVAL